MISASIPTCISELVVPSSYVMPSVDDVLGVEGSLLTASAVPQSLSFFIPCSRIRVPPSAVVMQVVLVVVVAVVGLLPIAAPLQLPL
jgi:hypothetical protein